MIIRPGGNAVVHFDTSVGGDNTAADDVDAEIYRGELLTSIVPTVTLSGSHYIVSFLVPANWMPYDVALVKFTAIYQGSEHSCTKSAGVIDPGYLSQELAVAEQVKTDNGDGTFTIRYYKRGSNKTVLLHTQVVSGDPCEGDVIIDVI